MLARWLLHADLIALASLRVTLGVSGFRQQQNFVSFLKTKYHSFILKLKVQEDTTNDISDKSFNDNKSSTTTFKVWNDVDEEPKWKRALACNNDEKDDIPTKTSQQHQYHVSEAVGRNKKGKNFNEEEDYTTVDLVGQKTITKNKYT
ncbi:hypothetical protein ACJX0J_018660, partial [Zea mays]